MTFAISAEPVPLQADPDGVVRVGNTRVTLETVIGAFLDGASAEEIAYQYRPLDFADIYAVIAHTCVGARTSTAICNSATNKPTRCENKLKSASIPQE